MVDKRLAGLEARAPALATLLSSSNVLIHTPEHYVDAAVEELQRLLDGGLMGVAEVATATGIAPGNLSKTVGLPPSRQTLACGQVWDAELISRYTESRRDHRKRKVHA